MGGRGSNSSINNSNSWRQREERYQKQTSGGVYFYSSPNSIFGMDIDPKMYNRLPKRMKDAVIAIDNTRTLDGNHATIYYINSNGVIDYYDEYGLGDFYATVRSITDVGNMNDYVYNGGYKVGEQLRRKR